MNIKFYQITSSQIYEVMLHLIYKMYKNTSKKILVLLPNLDHCKEFSDFLWGYKDYLFLPHLIVDELKKEKIEDNFWERQRILLTSCSKNENSAEIALCVTGVSLKDLQFQEIFYCFSSYNLQELSIAKKDWEFFASKGYSMIYNKQNENKVWEIKTPCF